MNLLPEKSVGNYAETGLIGVDWDNRVIKRIDKSKNTSLNRLSSTACGL